MAQPCPDFILKAFNGVIARFKNQGRVILLSSGKAAHRGAQPYVFYGGVKVNVKRKQAIDLLSQAVDGVDDLKVKTDIKSLGELTEAFLNTSDKSERKKLAAEYKKRHTELKSFLDDNPELVNSEVERALLSAALGGEYVEEEITIDSRGRRSTKRKIKKVAPNVSAALSYLQNKDKENWSPNPQADPELEDTSEIEEDIYGEES